MTERKKSAYRKVIVETTQSGDLKKQTTIDLSPWEFDSSDGGKAVSGFTCQIRVLKLGNKPKTSYVNFDPFNREIREALLDMYKQADKLKRL